MEHTPGPWEYSHPGIYSRGEVKRLVCDINGNNHHGENIANAKLIAAAPNLLKAIEDLTDMLNNHYGDDSDETPLIDAAFDAIRLAREGV